MRIALSLAFVIAGMACTPINDLKKRDAGPAQMDGEAGATRDAEAGVVTGVAATADMHCEQAGARSCGSSDAQQVLICQDGSWHPDRPCSAAESCTSRGNGMIDCLPAVVECTDREPGFVFCDANAKRRVCLDATRTTELACEELERCVMVNGEPKCRCVPGAVLKSACVIPTNCELENGGCDPLTVCNNGPDGRQCGQCPTDMGFVGDGASGCAPQLLSLKLSCGALDSALKPGAYEYRLQVPIFCDQLHIDGTAPEGTRVMLNAVSAPAQWTWDSPPLHVGETTLLVEVTSGFGVTSQYTFNIARSASQVAYLKASNADSGDSLGQALAASGDMVFAGAPWEDSSSATDPTNNDAADSGAVYAFAPNGDSWAQVAYLKADPVRAGEYLGHSLVSSGDTLLVGAPNRDPIVWYGRNTAAAPATRSGAVYVFQRSKDGWKLQDRLAPSSGSPGDLFGYSLALHDDTLLVGAPGDAPNGIEVGAAYVFTRQDGKWSELQKLTPADSTTNSMFGIGVALDTQHIVVGAPQDPKMAQRSGAAFTFTRASGTWKQEQRIEPDSATVDQTFGFRALFANDSLLITAPAIALPSPRGRVLTFQQDHGAWKQGQTFHADYPNDSDLFGSTLLLSGSTLIIGANGDSSGAQGVNGDASRTDSFQSGAVHVYAFEAVGGWSSTTYLKSTNSDANDSFGESIALGQSALFVSAPWEDSASRTINEGASDNSASSAGAVYVFR